MSTYQVRSLEEADQIIREHERKSKTYYALLRSTKNFGCVDVPACSNDENEVRFETVGVPYCGVPFFVAGLKILQCQSYRGRGGRKKKEIKIEITGSGSGVIGDAGAGDAGGEEEEPLPRPIMSKKKKKFGRVQKVGCTATIIMKEVIYYPEFQLFEHAKNSRIAIARQLKDALKAKSPVQKDRIIYVTVPAMNDHFGHSVGLGAPKSVCNNATKKIYVKNEFYGHNEPGSSKRVYYPVKQEKSVSMVTKKIKIDVEEDVDSRAQQVRELLQSIMGLTYKQPGTSEAYKELFKGLLHCKLKYKEAMDMGSMLPSTNGTSQLSVITDHIPKESSVWRIENRAQNTIVQNNPTTLPQPVSSTQTAVTVTANTPVPIQASATVSIGSNGITTQTTTTTTPVYQSPTVATTVATATTNGTDGSNQETSIFIEAMEAILNSQV